MRAAIASAEVGDDVLGDDPTVNRLQRYAADLLGHEAALFVPSGSMANQIALMLHCRPGDEVLVSEGAHVAFHEVGAHAAIAGVQLSAIGGGGVFTGTDVARAARTEGRLRPPTSLVCVENTHNRGGGIVWPYAALASVVDVARAHGLPLHLDGARLFNAAIASGRSPSDLASPFDTVTLSFSKGLGAPVGSVLAGRAKVIERATRLRKMLGGGMRQAGLLAAGAIWALEHNVDRLAEDHANARAIAERLHQVPGLSIALETVQTNMVMVDLDDTCSDASVLIGQLAERGVMALQFGSRRIRFVTHLDVTADDCLWAAEQVADAIRSCRAS